MPENETDNQTENQSEPTVTVEELQQTILAQSERIEQLERDNSQLLAQIPSENVEGENEGDEENEEEFTLTLDDLYE